VRETLWIDSHWYSHCQQQQELLSQFGIVVVPRNGIDVDNIIANNVALTQHRVCHEQCQRQCVCVCVSLAVGSNSHNTSQCSLVLAQSQVHVLQTPAVDISSTHVRDCLEAGISIRYLTPDTVIDYIKRNSLFRE
jgi:nicotinic acid mononucleotide adenylyltransferase